MKKKWWIRVSIASTASMLAKSIKRGQDWGYKENCRSNKECKVMVKNILEYKAYGGYNFSIAIGTLLVFLVFMGGAGALSDGNVSDKVLDNYSNITGSRGYYPDHPPGRPAIHPQRAEQFSNLTGTENMRAQAAASGDIITKIGHFGGVTFAVEVSGNYACTSQGSDFVVLNISNKMAPIRLGRLETSGNIMDIALAGNYAYVADGDYGLVIIDVANPAEPILKGSYDTAGYSWKVAVAGNYAYVADGDYGLVIIDVTNPAVPTLKGSYDTIGDSRGLAVTGNYAYVADYWNGLVIVDVTNPAAPTLKGSYAAWRPFGVAMAGNYAYVADESIGLVIVDVINPAAPTLKGRYDTAGHSHRLAVAGNYAYVADGYGLVIVDVTNPAAPILKGSFDTGDSLGVALVGNYAYVADGVNGLVIVNVSNPAAPTLKGSYDTFGTSMAVAVAGNYAYVADSSGLVIVDVTNPAAPILKGSFDTGDSLGVAVVGNYAYVANGWYGLMIIDVTNKAAPTLKGSYDTVGYSRGVVVEGNYAYVADGYYEEDAGSNPADTPYNPLDVWDGSGLVIIDVSNPAAPTLKGSYYNTGGNSYGVAVAGNYAYLADEYNGLVIFDISKPATPILKGRYDSGWSYGVAVAGNYAYVADDSNGLVIVDVSNPAVPTLKGSYDTAGNSLGVAVGGNYAYVADDSNGLVNVDISNPAAPTLKGSYDTAGNSMGVAVAGNYVYIADNNNGLEIFRINPPGIEITSPNSAENWTRGTNRNIRWKYSGSTGSNVKIELLKPGVANKVIRENVHNDGSYTWLIPATQKPGSDYKIKITSMTNASYSDTSDNPFTIPAPSFTVVSPDGSENWTRGTNQTIRWNSTESPGTYVKIELLKPEVANKVIISVTPNDGSYTWQISSAQVPGSDYRIKITSITNTSINDTSDNAFTIPIPSFTVVSPNGKENWTRGTTQTIRWNSTESPGRYVKIELLKPGVANKVIISVTPNDGTHPWLISSTQTPGSDYRIKITSTTNASNYDISDNNFSIMPPKFTVTSPDGGENWARGTNHPITWNFTGNPGNYVKIELLKNGLFNRTIFANTSNNKSHNWTVPPTQAPGADYKIRITSTTNPAYNDTSNNNFTIGI